METGAVITNVQQKDSEHDPVLPQNDNEIETIKVINVSFSTVCSEEKIKNSYGDVNVDLKRNIKEDESSEELASQQIIRDGNQPGEKNIVPEKIETYNEIGQAGTFTDFNQHTVEDSLPVSQFLLDRIMGANSHFQAIDSNDEAFAEENRNIDFSKITSKHEMILKEDSEDLADKIGKQTNIKMTDETAVNGSNGTKDPEMPINYKESIRVNLIEIKEAVKDLRNADSVTKLNAPEEARNSKIQTGSETLDNNSSDFKEKISSEDGKNVTDLEEVEIKHEILGKVMVDDNTSTTFESAEDQDAKRFNLSRISEKVTSDDHFELLINSEEIQDTKGSVIGEVKEKEKVEDGSTFVASIIEEKIIENEVGMEEVALRENLDVTLAKNDDTSNEKSLDSGDSAGKTERKQFKQKIKVLTTRPIEETIPMTEGVDFENIISFAVPNVASDSDNKVEEGTNIHQKAMANEIHDAIFSSNEEITDKKDSKPHSVILYNYSEKKTSEPLRTNFSAVIAKNTTEEDAQNNPKDELPTESANDDVDQRKNIKEDESYSGVYVSQTNLKDNTKSTKENVGQEKQEANDKIRSDTYKDFNQQTIEKNLQVSQFLMDQIIGSKSLFYAEDSNKKALDNKPYLSLDNKSQDDNEASAEDPKILNDSLKEVEMDVSQISKKIRKEELVGLCDSENTEKLSSNQPVLIEKLFEIANSNENKSKNLEILETKLKEEEIKDLADRIEENPEIIIKEERMDSADKIEEKPEIILKEERMGSADEIEEKPDIEMVDGTGTDSTSAGVEFGPRDTANKSNATVVEQTANTEIQLLPGSKTIVENIDLWKKNIPTDESKNISDMKQLQTNIDMVEDNTSKMVESALDKNAENSVSSEIVKKAENGTSIAISSPEVKESGSFDIDEIVRGKAAENKVLTEISSSEVNDVESEAEVQDSQFYVAKGLDYIIVRDNKHGEEIIENNDEQFKMMTTDEHVDRAKETNISDLKECGKQQEQKYVEVKNQKDENCMEENLGRKDAHDEVKNESEVQVKHTIEKSGHETEGKLSPPNKKQGTIFSGVRTKFKHSISSVKKAMMCSSSVTHLTQETR